MFVLFVSSKNYFLNITDIFLIWIQISKEALNGWTWTYIFWCIFACLHLCAWKTHHNPVMSVHLSVCLSACLIPYTIKLIWTKLRKRLPRTRWISKLNPISKYLSCLEVPLALSFQLTGPVSTSVFLFFVYQLTHNLVKMLCAVIKNGGNLEASFNMLAKTHESQ